MITAEEALKEAERFRKFVQLPEEERTGKSPMKAIVEDDREIDAIELDNGAIIKSYGSCTLAGELIPRVTKLEIYTEEQMGYSLWVAIYNGEEIVGRADLRGAKIVYKQKRKVKIEQTKK